MTIRSITITGEPVLHSVAQPVTVFDDALRVLVADMFETMDAAPGVGLAAPQVGVGLRVFVYTFEDEDGVLFRGHVVNPVLWISPAAVGELDADEESEGCLSVPGERFPLRRAERAVLTGVDVDGAPVRVEAEGWFARILQHEFDHLNGVLYVDRLIEPHNSAARKVIKKQRWGVPGLSWLPGTDDIDA